MRASAHIPPDSGPAIALHRALLAARMRGVARRPHPRSRALGRALRTTALGLEPQGDREWIARIEARRAEIPFELAATGAPLGIVPGGESRDGRADDPPPAPGRAERLGQAWEICRWTSISPLWGRFVMRLVRELGPRSCLELGTGLGLSGAYQAAALELNGAGSLVTVDAHEVGRIAERGHASLGLERRIGLRAGPIDEIVPGLLDEIAPVEFAFLDAEHSEAATVRHFDLVRPHLAEGAVVVLDDITQTEEMRRAWRAVIGRQDVSLALALRRVGIVVVGDGGRR